MTTRINILAALIIVEMVVASRFREKGINASTPSNQNMAIAARPDYGGFESQLKWGEHLVSIARCNDCHAAGKINPSTTDSALLLKEDQFINSMRESRPAETNGMARKDHSAMTDQELKAIFAYLKTAK